MSLSPEKLAAIKARLDQVEKQPWRYNPEHEMYIGTTHAIETYYGMLDLGRGRREYDRIDSKAVLTARAIAENERIDRLGKFLESCREDMQALISALEEKDE